MSTNRSRRIDRDTAEQLLGGATVGSEAGQASLTEQHAALAGLLAAVAAPVGDGELPGEREAMAAFREARLNPAPQPRRRSMVTTALAKAFTAKVLAAVFAVTAVGGVAVAASTGQLSAPFRGGSGERAPAAVGPSHPADRSRPAADGSGAPGDRSSAGPGTGAPGTGRPPTAGTATGAAPGTTGEPVDPAGGANLALLCRNFADRTAAGAKPSEVLAEPGLQPLVKAAGGADRVNSYCTAVTAKSKEPSAQASHANGGGKPSGDPSKANASTPATNEKGSGKG